VERTGCRGLASQVLAVFPGCVAGGGCGKCCAGADGRLKQDRASLYDHLERPGPVASPQPTVVIVHCKPWLCGQVQVALTERGVDVVGYADDGADGSGLGCPR